MYTEILEMHNIGEQNGVEHPIPHHKGVIHILSGIKTE